MTDKENSLKKAESVINKSRISHYSTRKTVEKVEKKKENGMKRLYLMRHEQTLFNVQHKIQGWCDSPLTSKGIEQAKAAKKILDERGIQFDHACCSTAERCCDTLELVIDLPYERFKGLSAVIHI